MTEAGTVYSVILAFLFAVAAGLVGSFALMKRMILAADVISCLLYTSDHPLAAIGERSAAEGCTKRNEVE